MADCVLVEELSSVCENDFMNENDVILDSVSDDSNITSDSSKSGYFVLSESEKYCSNFEINGAKIASCPELDSRVMGSDSEEFMASLKSISEEENGRNFRKKRCADRYDSSESSDSGIATLSCTDYSGTSDITEPGSPFSTSSHGESESESCGSPGKMPPTHWQPHSPRYNSQYLTSTHISSAKKHKSDNNNCYKKDKLAEYFKTNARDNLALHFSNPATKLSLVFQKSGSEGVEDDKITKLNRIPAPLHQHRKSLDWRDEPAVQVTSVFSKPRCSSKSSASKGSVSTKPQTPLSDDSAQKSPCSTLTDSNPSSPLSVSTVEQCSEKPSLPSPILRTPSIIRFPAHNGWKSHFLSDTVCRWSDCEEGFSSTSTLLEHLQVKHVNTQSLCETFVCLWNGCKVYDKASCSRSWLERHVLSHGGNKPFRCIVDGCGQRFSSQTMLERHVNQHFNQSDNSSSSGPSGKKSLESTPNKLFRRNGKKLRYRRQPFSARMFDYMDTGIMEGVQHALLEVTRQQAVNLTEEAATTNIITLHSKVVGRRVSEDGTNVLLRWFPTNILRDEWAKESELSLHHSRQVDRTKHQDELCTAPLFRRRPGQNQRKWSANSTR